MNTTTHSLVNQAFQQLGYYREAAHYATLNSIAIPQLLQEIETLTAALSEAATLPNYNNIYKTKVLNFLTAYKSVNAYIAYKLRHPP